jgi:dTDP-4-dehydrorhamnose 3,5-epimerase-like enzyme
MKVRKHYKIIEFPELGDERGNLVVIEGAKDIPFDIKRVFYMYGTDPTMVRGSHANRKSEFVLVNVSGNTKIKIDDGFATTVVELDKPRMGIYIPAMLWKDMYDFSEDAVLLVLSNEHYDADEYIRDYDEYKRIIEKEKMFVYTE